MTLRADGWIQPHTIDFLYTLRKTKEIQALSLCLTFVKDPLWLPWMLKVDQILNKSEWWIWHTHSGTPKFAQENYKNLTQHTQGCGGKYFRDYMEMRTWSQCSVTTWADVGDSNELQKTPTLQQEGSYGAWRPIGSFATSLWWPIDALVSIAHFFLVFFFCIKKTCITSKWSAHVPWSYASRV